MSALIEELKKEHVEIISFIEAAKNMKLFKQPEEGIHFLRAKKIIISHITQENVRFYPILIEAAKTDKRLHKILDIYASDMEIVSKDIIQFFDRYSIGIPDQEFVTNYEKTIAKLKSRIEREEIFLYNEYDRLTC